MTVVQGSREGLAGGDVLGHLWCQHETGVCEDKAKRHTEKPRDTAGVHLTLEHRVPGARTDRMVKGSQEG